MPRRDLLLVSMIIAVAGHGVRAQAPRDGYVTTADSVRLYYRLVGKGSDTIVILHGGAGMTMEYLLPDLHPLEARHVLLYYDQRGSGRSTIVTDTARLRATDHASDLEAIRQHFGIDRLKILGHSWGGMLAALYAFTHPQHVARLVLVESGPPRLLPYSPAFDSTVSARLDSASRMRLMALARATDTVSDPAAVCRMVFGYLNVAYWADTANVVKMKGRICTTPTWFQDFQRVNGAMLRSVGDYDWRPSLALVTAPVLVIHGTKDPIPLDAAREWAAGFPNGRLLTIQDSGHFPWIEQPDPFFSAVEIFLRGEWPPQAVLAAQRIGGVLPAAVASPARYSGNCPARIEFIGHVTVTVPGTRIDYRWERSNGDSTRLFHAQIGQPPAPGGPIDSANARVTQAVPSDFWRLSLPSHTGQFWEVLHIESPYDIRSAPARVDVDCAD